MLKINRNSQTLWRVCTCIKTPRNFETGIDVTFNSTKCQRKVKGVSCENAV